MNDPQLDVRRLLGKVPAFSTAPFEARDAVVACLRVRRAAAGEALVTRGARGDALFFLVEGDCEVRLTDRTLTLGPGDFFGEIGLLYGERTATVVALTPALLLALPGEFLPRVREVFPGIQALLEKAARERLQRT